MWDRFGVGWGFIKEAGRLGGGGGNGGKMWGREKDVRGEEKVKH